MKRMHRPSCTWSIARGRTLTLGERTLIMGIVNITPDSFSDGNAFLDPQHAIDHAHHLLHLGADILDLGAQSTRPGAALTLTPEEEQQRLAPVLSAIRQAAPEAILSVDTFHAATAQFAVALGADIINDVSGLTWDKHMATTLASLDCGVVLMHTRGKPSEWSTQPPLEPHTITPTVQQGLANTLGGATHAGIHADRILLDPGFGFGKRGAENFILLNQLSQLHALQRPLLAGLSRKGFLAPNTPAQQRLAATIAANTAAILQGAHILRVHDVAEAKQAAQFTDQLLNDQKDDDPSDNHAAGAPPSRS